ncbi:hypothetical protein [Streptomyces sp. NPDC005209]|uniref:hypothetical protein n=1 Tax=Streptomyces sp. NPDC005209 TaxID=3156715 RepID=UPI0033B2BBDA
MAITRVISAADIVVPVGPPRLAQRHHRGLDRVGPTLGCPVVGESPHLACMRVGMGGQQQGNPAAVGLPPVGDAQQAGQFGGLVVQGVGAGHGGVWVGFVAGEDIGVSCAADEDEFAREGTDARQFLQRCESVLGR